MTYIVTYIVSILKPLVSVDMVEGNRYYHHIDDDDSSASHLISVYSLLYIIALVQFRANYSQCHLVKCIILFIYHSVSLDIFCYSIFTKGPCRQRHRGYIFNRNII